MIKAKTKKAIVHGTLATIGIVAIVAIIKKLVRKDGLKGLVTIYKNPFVVTQDWRKHWKTTQSTYSINDDYCIVY